MNEEQVLKQVRHLLRAQVWTGGAEVVFPKDSVRISVAPTEQALKVMRTPIALIRPLDAQSDPAHDEEPDMLHAGVSILIMVSIPSDTVGEAPLIGGNRATVNGQTTSKGRGILEIEEELFNAVEKLNSVDGVEIQFRGKGAAAAQLDEEMGYIAWREYQFEAICTADRFYHPGRSLAATAIGGGQVTLTWNLPPARFDRYKMILRRESGATAPTSPTGGTGVTLSGDLATSVTDSPGAGQFSYALFVAYDETHDPVSTEERYSDAVTKTVTAT